ncbi:MAG: hypothetical protein EXQ71_03800 [Acidimicrobiia bacterium]|nr:hypothetical protein [Acidimicrobiia bacterium]
MASTDTDALAAIDQEGHRVGLVVSDVTVPDSGSREGGTAPEWSLISRSSCCRTPAMLRRPGSIRSG